MSIHNVGTTTPVNDAELPYGVMLMRSVWSLKPTRPSADAAAQVPTQRLLVCIEPSLNRVLASIVPPRSARLQ